MKKHILTFEQKLFLGTAQEVVNLISTMREQFGARRHKDIYDNCIIVRHVISAFFVSMDAHYGLSQLSNSKVDEFQEHDMLFSESLDTVEKLSEVHAKTVWELASKIYLCYSKDVPIEVQDIDLQMQCVLEDIDNCCAQMINSRRTWERNGSNNKFFPNRYGSAG